MEEFLAEIESYARAVNLSPGTVVQYATKTASGSAFAAWKSGRTSPHMATADKVRAYMRDNPPPEPLPGLGDPETPEVLPDPEARDGEAAA